MVKILKIIFFSFTSFSLILVFYILFKTPSGRSSFIVNLIKPSTITATQTVPLEFLPENSAGQTGEIWKVKIMTKTNLTILGADLEINFNPQILEFIDIAAGERFPSPIVIKKQIDQNRGYIFYALGTLNLNTSNNGTLAQLDFKIKSLPPFQKTILSFGKLTDLAFKEKVPVKLDFTSFEK